MSLWHISVISTIIAFAFAFGRYIHRPSWEYLRNRVPDKKPWVAIYSSNDLPAVEAALEDIKNAFLLRNDDVFRLRPNDLLLDIYKAAYPHKWADTLEFETLTLSLKKKGISEKVLADLTNPTVGDIINLCLALHSRDTGCASLSIQR